MVLVLFERHRLDAQFDQLRRTWDHLGGRDPLWAILTDPKKRGNRWDLESFLETGRREIDEVLRRVTERHPDVPRACALDFGCGVGRLSRALASHFGRVIGIDVAASMIRGARELNQDRPNCEFVLNERGDLGVVASGSVDFVYSSQVLQYIDWPFADRYIREFVRVLSPKGLAVFQMIDRPGRSIAALVTRLVPQARSGGVSRYSVWQGAHENARRSPGAGSRARPRRRRAGTRAGPARHRRALEEQPLFRPSVGRRVTVAFVES
jgi:SAM-dependent methyltransferase